MKNIPAFLLALIIITSCSPNRYLLNDSNDDKYFLVSQLEDARKMGSISKRPIIVVDGKPHRYDYELKDSLLNISKSQIKKIDVLKREVGIRIYGDFAKDGAVLITTHMAEKGKEAEMEVETNDDKSLDKSNVLIILGNKIISKKDLEGIDPNDIESVQVIKNKEEIKKYTKGDYDGVILIKLKN